MRLLEFGKAEFRPLAPRCILHHWHPDGRGAPCNDRFGNPCRVRVCLATSAEPQPQVATKTAPDHCDSILDRARTGHTLAQFIHEGNNEILDKIEDRCLDGSGIMGPVWISCGILCSNVGVGESIRIAVVGQIERNDRVLLAALQSQLN